jgi:arabinose-5-phosphate isomerase
MKSRELTQPQTTIQYAVESLDAQSAALSVLAKRIDNAFVDVVNLVLECRGRVVICGMGKSGLVGKKIAATLASTGTASFFMHPGEALHGDLGMIRSDDVVVLISNSGETEEVLRLLPAILHFGNSVVAMVGRIDSTLARAAHFVLDVSVEREVCPLNLAPTTSTVATMAMGDALAVALMQVRDFQPQDFARFHPGGNLGRRLLTRVKDVMHRELPLIVSDATLQDTMLKMTAGRLGLAVVIDQHDNLHGLFTDGDLRRALSRGGASMNDAVKNYMTRNPITISADAMLIEAEETMHQKKIRCLIVTEEKGRLPIGIVEIFDR